MKNPFATQLGRDYFWNSAASLMSSLSLVVMLMVVTRTAGIAAGGIFSLAIAVGQQFQTLGMYEVRTYHVTDVQRRFSFGTYLATRIITTVLMLGGIVGRTLWTGGDMSYMLLVIAVASLRVFDTVEDVFYSEFQRENSLDIGGKASFWRIFTTTASFCGALLVTHDLELSTIITLVASTVAMVALYVPYARGRFSLRPQWDLGAIWRVLVACLPLFLASFLAMYLANAPRYSVEHNLDATAQGYFAIVYMPAVAINMLSLLVFRPLLTRMAQHWASGDWATFIGLVRKGFVAASGATAVVALVSWFIGTPILTLVFGQDVTPYRTELMVLVVGGGLNAFSVILYYALTTMRRQTLVFLCYATGAGTVALLCALLVPPYGLVGAALAYTGAMLVLSAAFCACILIRRPASPAPSPSPSSPTVEA